MLLAACAPSPTSVITHSQTTGPDSPETTVASTVGDTTTAPASIFSDAVVKVGDVELRVWVADQREERVQGLRGVERLPSGIEGMLFVFDNPTETSFIMEDTSIPLDVWFFDSGGVLVGSHEMTPCTGEPCQRYPTPGAVSWALETPRGEQDFPQGDRLSTSR